jgi:hypothetical protein
MSKDQKIIKVKVGLLELAKQLGNVSHACTVMGYSRDSFLSVEGAVREGWRGGAAGDVEAPAGLEEPGGAGDRRRGRRARDRAADVGPGAGGERAAEGTGT